MIYVVIAIVVIGVFISDIVEYGSFFSKLSLTALVCTLAFLLLRLFTGVALMTTLAKVGITVSILSALIAILNRMAR